MTYSKKTPAFEKVASYDYTCPPYYAIANFQREIKKNLLNGKFNITRLE